MKTIELKDLCQKIIDTQNIIPYHLLLIAFPFVVNVDEWKEEDIENGN